MHIYMEKQTKHYMRAFATYEKNTHIYAKINKIHMPIHPGF